MNRDIVKHGFEWLEGRELGQVACVCRACRSAARLAWGDFVRRTFPSALEMHGRRTSCSTETFLADEGRARRFYRAQLQRRLLCDRLCGSAVEAHRPVIRSLADVTFFVRFTDGDRILWEGDATGSFEVDHVTIDLREVWTAAKPRWPHLARLFELRQAHGRSIPPWRSFPPPNFIVDPALEAAAFQDVAIALVAIRAADDKMCPLAKLTSIERVDLEDLDYSFSTEPLQANTFMTFREPAQQAGIQGFLQFWTDDGGDHGDEIDCLNLFVSAGKFADPSDDFVEDYDLNEAEVISLFDSFQWT